MTCRMCRQDKQLVRSHIIPEFMFAALYDEKHRFHELKLDERNKYRQKGFRESILCGECEQILSKYERYASLVLNGGARLSYYSEAGKAIRVEGIEYAKFKIFALSILWRAGISSLDIFSDVTLGSHEDVLRKIILEGEPGEPNVYSFLVCPIIHEGNVVDDLITQPSQKRMGGHTAYRFIFGGLAWVFIVSSHPAPKEIVNASISKCGNMTMIFCHLNNIEFIIHIAQELVRNKKIN